MFLLNKYRNSKNGLYLSTGTRLRLVPVKRYRPFFLFLYLFTGTQFFPYILYIGPVDQVLYSYIGPANLTMQILGTDSHIGPADQVLYSYIGPADQVLYSYIGPANLRMQISYKPNQSI